MNNMVPCRGFNSGGLAFVFWAALLLAFGDLRARALDGAIGIHDPSTVIKCDEKYYVYGTGRGMPFLVSTNGFDWERGGRVFDQIPDSVKSYVPANNGSVVWAPDVIKIKDRYFLYYAVSAWGSYVSAVGLMTNPTLDPASPDYKWTDGGMVVHSSEGEDLNAIDPGVCHAPDGRLWLCYGSYHGNIQLVELNPATGQRIATNAPVSVISSESEAADIIYHQGYYYLFVNHGGCCQGSNSTYNIRVGRSKVITGPYFDRYGGDMAGGGGNLFLAAKGNDIGPGHFGLLEDDGVQKFSCHYEAEVGRSGRSILDIRPLLWTLDGWPAAGENVRAGTYQVRSLRTGTILAATGTNNDNDVETARYLARDHQKWEITPAGGGLYKITNIRNAAALTAAGSAVIVAVFAGGDNQLWKLDQLTDASYRIASQSAHLALTAMYDGKPGNGVTLKSFTGDDAQHWEVTSP